MRFYLLLVLAVFWGCSDATKGTDDKGGDLENSKWSQFPDPVYDCPLPMATLAEGSAIVPIPDPEKAVERAFSVDVDLNHNSFDTEHLQPLLGIAEVKGNADDLRLEVAVKRQSQKTDVLWLELYFINDGFEGIAGATIEFRGIDASDGFELYSYDDNVWAGATPERTLSLGRIAPEGVGRMIVGIGSSDRLAANFDLTLRGTTSSRVSTSSSTLAVTPDGKEVWVPFADANAIIVVDADSGKSVARIPVEGGPRGIALTPSGDRALVVAPGCNQLVVIDRSTRGVVQRFGVESGIGIEPRHVVVSPSGAQAFVSSYVGDKVTVFEQRTDGFAFVDSVRVGRRPTGLSVSPDGQAVFVSHFLPRGGIDDNEGWITSIDTSTYEIFSEGTLVDDGNPEVMTCLQQVPGFEDYTTDELKMEGVYTQLWGVFLTPSGNEAFVPNHRIVPFPIVEGDFTRAKIEFRQGSISTSNIVPFKTSDPSHIAVRQLDSVHQINDREPEYLRCLNPNQIIEFATAYPQSDRPGILQTLGAIRPTGATPLFQTGQVRSIAFTRGGRRGLFVAYTSDEVAVVDTSTYHPTAAGNLRLTGSNPTGLVVSPDGKVAYVAYDNSPFISVLDISAYTDPLPGPSFVPFWLEAGRGGGASASFVSLERVTRDISNVPQAPPIAEIKQIELVDSDPVDPVIRRGKILFSSANPEKYPYLSVHREASCNNCHPSGGNDGSMWPTLEGERRTLSLLGGVGGRGWLHASATYHGIYSFVDYVTRERLGGTGLAETDRHALAKYVAEGIPRLQHPEVDARLASRGKEIFDRKCTSCHAGARLTSGRPAVDDPYGGPGDNEPVLSDLGTARGRVGVILGPPFTRFFPGLMGDILEAVAGDRDLGPGDFVFDAVAAHQRPLRKAGHLKAPSLVNVWDNVLFFHDGRFTRLDDAVGYILDTLDLKLSEEDRLSLVEHLRTL